MVLEWGRGAADRSVLPSQLEQAHERVVEGSGGRSVGVCGGGHAALEVEDLGLEKLDRFLVFALFEELYRALEQALRVVGGPAEF